MNNVLKLVQIGIGIPNYRQINVEKINLWILFPFVWMTNNARIWQKNISVVLIEQKILKIGMMGIHYANKIMIVKFGKLNGIGQIMKIWYLLNVESIIKQMKHIALLRMNVKLWVQIFVAQINRKFWNNIIKENQNVI